ncbi:TY5A [Symbiodinium sp. KB8]|nr:TY5A [Symbiodinium sp. KB8]
MVKGPKLKAVEAQETSPKAGAKVSTTPDLCRYFAKASGCRRGSTTALVDSGATHSLRTAATQWEWDTADNVIVQLAGNHNLPMRITSAGTLLMPYKDNIHSAGSQLQTQTIVPMGQLIETLGYEMMWNPAGCYLTSPEGQRIKLQVHQGCPQLQELEALSLIARLEDRKLEQLKNTTLTTRDKVNMSMMSMERTWQHYLFDYVTTGSFESGLRAVRDAPYLEDLPGECLAHTIPTQGLWSGWDIMKEIGFLTRSQKRRLFTSKRWVVHLFAGKEGHWEIFKLDQGDTMVIELDVARCAGQSLLRSEVWRMLLWGAKEGKIDVIMGGPPGRSQQQGREGLREIKSLTLTARMMWLFSVAQVGREVNAGASNRDRDVAFVLEYPEGNFTQQQREQEQAVVDAEEMFTTPGRRGGVASWEESQVYWEEVQRPRLEAYTGQATVQMEVNFWNTRMWKSFQREDNHMVYRRDCATCVMARGPLTPGLDATSKGTMGKNLKYLTVAKYMVPRSFVEASVGQTPPKDNGLRPESQETQSSPAGKEEEQQLTQEQEDLLKEVFGDDHSPLSGDEGDRRLEVVHLPESMPLELVEEETGAIRELSEAEDEAEDLKFEEESFKDVTMQQGDCISPEMTYLIFAAPLPNNQSATVKRAVQDVALYLQMHGFPIYRFHADKGEFFNHGFRNWLREQGIYATWSEPSIPQGNGHAESTVRWVKDRIRALLGSASLPIRLWPTAAMAAAAEQRARVLKWKSMLAAPYGSTVHLRKKGFDKAGPLKREHGLESKWMVGKYVGLSTILHHGHLVYVPGEKDEAEKFYHTMHVRPNLVDPGGPETVVRADMAPKPRRRIVEKTNQGEVEMRKVSLSPEEVQHRATRGADEVLAAWDSEKALQLVKDLASAGFYEKKKFGVYRHGGIVGAMDGMVQYPALTKVLVQLVMESIPEATFTSVLVSCNAHKAMHRDLNNDPNTLNYVVPVVAPVHGGELWIELRRGDHLCGEIQKRAIGDKDVFGQTRDIVEGESIQFHPRRHHEVSEWTGDRVVLIAYTPDCLGKLSQDVLEQLHELDFPVPISQLPEYHGGSNVPNPVPEDSAKPHLYSVEVGEEPEEQTSDWVMYLDLEPGLIKVAEAECSTYQPRMWKTEVSYTKNIESVLATLTAPLDVVHNVCSEEVYSNMEAWKPAIMKEVAGIEAAVQRLKPGTAERGEWLNRSGVQRLPMKFVFTIKPNDKADMANKDTWYKRKARLVICGNMAANDGAQVYTEAAPAEAVRTGLTIATKNKWSVAILDVVAAFIKTPLGRSKNDPIVIAQPPRLLETLGVTGRMELWGLLRALYGLREAPMLWGSFRDDTLRAMPPPRGLRWQQGKAITSWWTVRNASGAVQALIIVYVDDFMICGPQDLVKEIGDTIRGTWDTSELTFLSPTTPIRFLGMELQVESEDGGEILVLQQGYIAELLRTHSVKSTQLDKVPITKELMVFSDDIQQVPPDLVKRAQQVTGEVLWVSQRTRPDLAFATAMMSSMSTKDPQGVIAVGEKILGYLQKTKGYALRTCWNGKGLVMFCDAAFAPLGGRSHSGWLVVYGGTPLLWRSGRQQMVTLSSAEAELLAMIDGAIAAKGVESFLMDVGEYVEEKQIALQKLQTATTLAIEREITRLQKEESAILFYLNENEKAITTNPKGENTKPTEEANKSGFTRGVVIRRSVEDQDELAEDLKACKVDDKETQPDEVRFREASSKLTYHEKKLLAKVRAMVLGDEAAEDVARSRILSTVVILTEVRQPTVNPMSTL